MNKHQDIIDDVLRAVDASKLGRTHPRLNQMETRTAARNAAFYPPKPEHLRIRVNVITGDKADGVAEFYKNARIFD